MVPRAAVAAVSVGLCASASCCRVTSSSRGIVCIIQVAVRAVRQYDSRVYSGLYQYWCVSKELRYMFATHECSMAGRRNVFMPTGHIWG